MSLETIRRLKIHGIQPSAQRLAVASYVLHTEDHPSAEQVLEEVQKRVPMLSRATVYNTLNLFVDKGLLKQLLLAEGKVVFDPKTDPHHHFIDETTGSIHDIPWDVVEVDAVEKLKGYQVSEYMVVMRGKKLGAPRTTHHSRRVKPKS